MGKKRPLVACWEIYMVGVAREQGRPATIVDQLSRLWSPEAGEIHPSLRLGESVA